jgi:hypothetical protein
MSQEQFVLEFGVELATLRNRDQHRSEPDTAALICAGASAFGFDGGRRPLAARQVPPLPH